MTKEELAEQFAEQKNAELESLIKEAYLKGYEQALFDTNKSIIIDGISYVDMGLPSGTLWSKHPLWENGKYIRVNYLEAQNLPIPTKDQWEELFQKCAFKKNEFIAPLPSCQRIGFDFWRDGIMGEECNDQTGYKFWIKDEIDDANKAPVMVYCIKTKKNIEYRMPSEPYRNDKDYLIGSDNYFTGYKLPVFLVKNKE